MRSGKALTLLTAMMMVLACGGTSEEKAVENSYNELLDAMEAADGQQVFRLLSSNTRGFMNRLASAMTDVGAGDYQDGADMFTEFLQGEGISGYDRNVTSVTVEGNTAVLQTSQESMDFVLEDDVWKADLEGFIREGMEETLEGTGITVDDILEGNLNPGLMPVPENYTVGTGTAPVTLTNALGGWEIHGVMIDPSSDPEWSAERLGDDYILAEDQAVTIMVEPGTYDIRVIDEDADTYSKWEVEIGPDGYEWNVTLSDMD
ncbi:MAG: hypothetical protein R6U39_08280 [Candidatus Aegiribacteria sp.]